MIGGIDVKQTKTYCDLCGKEIEKGYGVDGGTLKLTGRINKNVTKMGRIAWEDICHICSIELFKMLHKYKEEKRK